MNKLSLGYYLDLILLWLLICFVGIHIFLDIKELGWTLYFQAEQVNITYNWLLLYYNEETV